MARADNALLRFGPQGPPTAASLNRPPSTCRSARFDPNYSAVWKLLGQARQRLGMLEEARQARHKRPGGRASAAQADGKGNDGVFLCRARAAARAPEA